MATQPPTPYSPPPGPAYDNADFGEALVLAHGNATHLPSADFPIYDPDTFYSMHTGRGELPVRRRLGAFPHQRHQPQHLSSTSCTIAGGEVLGDW